MANPVNLELSAKISSWRLKAADGTLTLDEMKEAITHLRAGRVAAASAARASAGSRKKAAVAIPAAADMLNELENLE